MTEVLDAVSLLPDDDDMTEVLDAAALHPDVLRVLKAQIWPPPTTQGGMARGDTFDGCLTVAFLFFLFLIDNGRRA
jgi:hypothetical protein